MKRTFAILILAVFMLVPAFSQITVDVEDFQPSGRLIKVDATISGTTAYNSSAFSFAGYVSGIGDTSAKNPLGASYSLDTTDLAAGTEIDSASVVIQGSNDLENYVTIDTLSMTLGTTATTYTTLDLNLKRFAYYRVRAIGLGSNTNAVLRLYLFAYKKDG